MTALVRRMNTLGDYQAQPFSGPFISHSIAARMKGLSILSEGGKQSSNSIVIPLEPTLGLITPGMLVEIDNTGSTSSNWRGMVRGVSIDASWDKSKGPTISKTLTIERHYGDLL